MNFILNTLHGNVSEELKIVNLDTDANSYETTYGMSQKPFGILKIRIVEFLSQAFQMFPKEMHKSMFENDLYNVLLYYFELYPYHNILH